MEKLKEYAPFLSPVAEVVNDLIDDKISHGKVGGANGINVIDAGKGGNLIVDGSELGARIDARLNSLSIVHPFRVELNAGGDFQIYETTASYLHENYLAASGLTIDELFEPFAVADDTHAWIEVAINSSIVITACELKTGTAFPEPFVEVAGVQTQYNIPVGRVVDDAQPGVPGFNFQIAGSNYHWQQLLREHQIMESYCFSGIPGLRAFPWQGI